MRSGQLIALAFALTLAACRSDRPKPSAQTASSTSPPASTATASATSTARGGVPIEQVERTLNPKGASPYEGPTGTLRGTVRVTGEPPPPQDLSLRSGCGAAAATYGKLFRVGQDDRLADVLVAVVGYRGYVPTDRPSQSIAIEECAFSSRTVALTFGQYLEVHNRDDQRSYLPVLVGARSPAKLVAVPKGTVKLYAAKPGRYLLTDQMGHTHMKADVFVVKYPTFDVTGLDGQYEIRGIPTGEAQVRALLPAADMTVVRKALTIEPGDNELDLTIRYDAADAGAPVDAASPSASGQ